MKPIINLAVVGCLSLAGCDDKTSTPAVSEGETPAHSAPPAAPPASDVAEYKPEYAIAIEESTTDPKQYSVTWSVKVNTGGWAMKTDSVLVEEQMGKMAARIYVTLEQPGAGEMVTQAFETLTGRHDAGATKIERVEFSVRRQVRGVKYDTPALYGVVKTIKYPY